MRFKESKLKGAYLVELNVHEDQRGFFCETWSQREFQRMGIDFHVKQSNMAFNRQKGTLRGLHFQVPPYSEEKLVSVSQGAIFDVFVDLRHQSPTFGKWDGFTLQAGDFKMVFIPKGFAHGYQTLEDNTIVNYLTSQLYEPQAAAGIIWNDPDISIDWPISHQPICSPKDLQNPQLIKMQPNLFSELT